MTDSAPPDANPRVRRPADIALLILATGVAIGCLGFGAPPRIGPMPMDSQTLTHFLGALGPTTLVRLSIAVALTILVASRLTPLRGDPAAARLRPLLLLGVLGAVSVAPLPAWLVSLLSPFSGATWDHLSEGGLELQRTLSLWPDGTLDALWTLGGVVAVTAAVFAAVRRSPGADPDRGRRAAVVVLAFVAAVATLESAYGLASTYIFDDGILGLPKLSGKGRVTGTFILAPMLGVWAGMGACAAIGLFLVEWVRTDGRRAVVLAASTSAVVVCSAGAVLSLSRIMLAALAAGLLVTCWLGGGVLGRIGHRASGAVLRVIAAGVPVAGAAAAAFVPPLRERLGYLLHYAEGGGGPAEPRFAGWQSTWELFQEAPILGTGLGSFGRAIHLTQSDAAPAELWFAHCEPLNLLSDAGIVGFLVVVTWLATTLLAGRFTLRDADPGRALAAAAAFGGAVVVLVGGLADFQTQFLVVALPFGALLALPAALAAEPRHATDAGSPLRWRLVGGAAALLVVMALTGFVGRWAHVAGGLDPVPNPGERHLVRARHAIGTLGEAQDRAAALDAIRVDLLAAAQSDPLHDETHLWRALAALTLRSVTGDPEIVAALRDEALASLGRARWVSRGHAGTNLQIGLLYLDLLRTQPAPFGPPGDTAMDALREASALVPQTFGRAWQEALARELEPEDLAQIVPERPYAQRTWAAHLRSLGRDTEAAEILDRLDRNDARSR